jgi:positive regulator of sigma E activity
VVFERRKHEWQRIQCAYYVHMLPLVAVVVAMRKAGALAFSFRSTGVVVIGGVSLGYEVLLHTAQRTHDPYCYTQPKSKTQI